MDLMELLKTRRTYRRFKQEEIPKNIIEEIVLSSRYASSAANRQPLSYIVINEPSMVADVFALTRWAGYLPAEDGQPKDSERPVLFIAVVINSDINASCDTDAGLAISNMTLTAWNHGIGSCIIGACDKGKLSEIFELSDSQVLHSVVAFGYPSHKSFLSEEKDGDIKYYLNENRDYVVPKRKTEDIVKYLIT